MFGSFAAERKDEPVVYGLITPIKTYNPLAIQNRYYANIFSYLLRPSEFFKKIQKIYKGPGWSVEKQKYFQVPKVDQNSKPWETTNNHFINYYLFYQVIYNKKNLKN